MSFLFESLVGTPIEAHRPGAIKCMLLDEFEPVHAKAQIEAQPPELRKHMTFLHI